MSFTAYVSRVRWRDCFTQPLQSPSNQCRMLLGAYDVDFLFTHQQAGGRDNYYWPAVVTNNCPCCDCVAGEKIANEVQPQTQTEGFED